MEHITENAPVLFPQKPEPAPPETVEMKRSYSRAGLSVAVLYGAISASGGIAAALIMMLVFVFYELGSFPVITDPSQLSYYVDSLLGYLPGRGVIATLLTVYLLVQTGAWIVGIVLMRLVLPKGTPIKKRSLSFGRFLVIALMCISLIRDSWFGNTSITLDLLLSSLFRRSM